MRVYLVELSADIGEVSPETEDTSTHDVECIESVSYMQDRSYYLEPQDNLYVYVWHRRCACHMFVCISDMYYWYYIYQLYDLLC